MRSAAGRARLLTERILGSAALMAGGLLLFGLLAGRDDETAEEAAAPDERGYYLTDAKLTDLGLDGKPRVVVRAQTIEQRLADESVQLQHLELDYTTTRAGAWHVTAERGRMPSDRTSLQLEGNVRVAGSPEPTGARAIIVTDELEYNTRANVIQTASPVAIQFGTHELLGRGLRVALNDGTLRLESNVNGTFTP
jgi:LPS export ABC transporter protein LptC